MKSLRKFIKIILVFLVSILGFLILLFTFINLPFTHKFVTTKANQILSNAGLPVQIQSIRTLLPSTVKLHGVTIADSKSDTIIFAGEVKAKIVLPALMSHKVKVGKVYVNSANVAIIRNTGTARFNIAEVFSPGPKPEDVEPEKGKKFWEISIRKGNLSNISFQMEDSSVGMQINQELEGVKLKDFDLLLLERAILLNSVDIRGARGGVKLSPGQYGQQGKQGNTNMKTEKGAPWNYGLMNLSLHDMDFSYNHVSDSLLLKLILDKGLIKVHHMDLNKREVDIDKIALNQATATILSGHLSNDSNVPEKHSGGSFPWDFMTEKLNLERVGIILGDYGDPNSHTPVPDFSVTDLNLSLSDIQLNNINAAVDVKDLSFDASNGFSIKKMRGGLDSDSESFRLDLAIETGNSQFNLEGVAQENFFNIISAPAEIQHANISLHNTSFSLRDLSYFKTDLQQNPFYNNLASAPLLLKGNIGLSDSLFYFTKVSISQAQNFTIAIEGSTDNPFESAEARGDLQLAIPEIDIAWLGDIFKALGIETYMHGLSAISIESHISNSLSTPDFSLQLKSNLGNIDLSGSLDLDCDTISVIADFDRLMLGTILNIEELGFLIGSGKFTGRGFTQDTMIASIALQVDSLRFNDYDYTASKVEATLSPGVYNVNLLMDDPSLRGNLNAILNSADSIIEMQASGAVFAQLNELHFFHDTLSVETNLEANLTKRVNSLDTDLGIFGIVFTSPQDSVHIHQIEASFRIDSVQSLLRAESDFLHIDMQVAKPISEMREIGQDYGSYLATFTDAHHKNASTRVMVLPEINATGFITYNDALGLLIQDTSLQFTSIDFSILNKSSDHRINYNIKGTDLKYNVVKIGNLNATIIDSAGMVHIQIAADDNSINASPANKLRINSRYSDWQSMTELTIHDKQDEVVYGLDIASVLDSNNIVFTIPSRQLILNHENWQMDTTTLLSVNLADKTISPALKMHTDSSFFHLTTEREEGILTYKGELGNVAIESLLQEGLLPGKPAGSLSGSIDYSLIGNIERKLNSDLKFRNVRWSGLSFSNIGVNGSLKLDSSKAYSIDMSALLDSSKIVLKGDKIYGGSGTIHTEFSSVPINTFQPLVRNHLSELAGRLSGFFNMSSSEDHENFYGSVYITDASLRIDKLNTKFKIPEDSVMFSGQKVVFDKFRVLDSLDNELLIDGFMNFSDEWLATLDMEVSSSQLQVMNRSEKEDVPLYGNIFIDSRLSFKGPLANPDIKGKILLSEGTDVFYRYMEDLSLSETEKIVSFVTVASSDGQEKKSPIATQSTLLNSSVETKVEIDPTTRINFNLAKRVYKIDVMIKGGASLNYHMLNNNQVALSGKYEISEGTADVKLIGWPNKSFRIAEGGFIRWEGQVDNPELSFEALNRVSSSYTNPVDGKQRNVDFNVILQLSNQLSDLDISFTINTTDRYLMNIINTLSPEEQMRQAITILLFELIDLPGISTSSDYMSQQVNQLLASQLNQLTKTTIQGVDISFGIDSYVQSTQSGGEETKTSLSYEVRKNFLNNRAQMELSGRLNDLNQQHGASDLSLNNISFEYRLDSAATKYLKVYNEQSYEDVFTGEITKTGVGFTYRKRYKTFKDIWRRKKNNMKTKNQGK